MKSEPRAVTVGDGVHIDPARIPQHTKLQIGAIFLKAFMRDYETPEFQECYQRWKQEKEAKAAPGVDSTESGTAEQSSTKDTTIITAGKEEVKP